MKKFLLALCIALAPASIVLAQSIVDGSGTVTTGGTSQLVFAQNTNRSYLMCQNPTSATETLFVNLNSAASTTAGSIELAAGGSATWGPGIAPNFPVFVTAVTTGHRFVCKQY
jgi:hypothetical protein